MPIIFRMRANEQEEFIINYLKKNKTVDVCNQDFHDKFYDKFGGIRKLTNYGGMPVYKAQRLLSIMTKKGILERNIVGLLYHETGFPNWVYVYELLDLEAQK